ncbi:MAG TPA: tripartite tricarboxylate transporter substrate binding protein [Burkholderiales bacterium]|nr:tripartite tricarboxylate transporter substrate binding protein [Burkholderiales bacterium]
MDQSRTRGGNRAGVMIWHRVLSALSFCALAAGAYAQTFPVKPVRMVNPAAPGGNSDIFFRLLQPKMSEVLGQPLVMDYRPGAGGTVGGEVIARSAPDGYTTGIVAASFVINPAMIRKMPYDTAKDFTALGIIVDVPSGLVVHPSLPARNVKQLIALARARPGQIFYSTSGRGTVGHLAAELLNSTAGIQLVHVPYKGAGPAVIDLLAGHIQLQFASIPILVGHVQGGKLRMIAQTGEKRAATAPDTPTMIESGLPGFVVRSPFGFVGPAGMPKAVVDKLNTALVTAIRDPENHKALVTNGAEPIGSSAEEHAASVRSEIEKWKTVARQAHIEPQ